MTQACKSKLAINLMLNLFECRVNLLLLCLMLPISQTHAPLTRNRCELKLVADYEFFRVIGNKNYANAARYLINLIERVNGIFSLVDWGLDVHGNRLKNLGFSIKEIKIYDRAVENTPSHFNSDVKGEMSPIDILKSFSREEGSNGTCLTVLVTARPLKFGVLGMSNIGSPGQRGICATRQQNGTFMNTALVTVKRNSELMITRVVDLVLAHELGHSWGSVHDDQLDEECVPQNSRDGRFVMWESANTGYDKNNYKFSPCSVRSIHRVLYALAHRCLVEEKGALCGNGILEDGEQCDCGAQLNLGQSDRCCTADCKLKPNAICSPRHSECCSDQCAFLPAGTSCHKESLDTCKDKSVCSGITDKCPEPKALKDGTNCTDGGKCRAGECMPFCRSISPDLQPCLCEDASVACRRCCRSMRSGICSPVEPAKWLPDDSMCILGQCNRRVCEKKATDSGSIFWRFLDNFKGPTHRKFLADYLVFIIVPLSLLIWCPCGAFIVYKDQQKRQKLAEKREAAQKNVQVMDGRKRITPFRSSSINDKSKSATGKIRLSRSAAEFPGENGTNGRAEDGSGGLAMSSLDGRKGGHGGNQRLLHRNGRNQAQHPGPADIETGL